MTTLELFRHFSRTPRSFRADFRFPLNLIGPFFYFTASLIMLSSNFVAIMVCTGITLLSVYLRLADYNGLRSRVGGQKKIL